MPVSPRVARAVVTAALIAPLLGLAAPVFAQTEARFGLDSAIGADVFRGEHASDRPLIVVDVTAVAHLGNGWLAYVRPWFLQARTTKWEKEIYQAALQYTRPGRVNTRLDLGYIASPIGLGIADIRPGENPTIGPHYSFFIPMPAFDAGAPAVTPMAATYPLGGEFTASTARWDGRVALVSSAPNRDFALGSADNPARSPAVEIGAGFTPRVGLRLGGSFARADYATAAELTAPGPDRSLTMTTLEGEWAFGHTKLSAEVTRDRFAKASGADSAYAWFVQGSQAITPRIFVGGRHESVSAPVAMAGPLAGTRPQLRNTEATFGYKLSTEFTLRTSVVARKFFWQKTRDQQAGVQLVWTKRWW